MAGFFKKLFNRITGKPNEEAVVEVAVPAALPAPEPEVTPEPVKSVVKTAPPKKVEATKPEKKKPEAKKPAAKVEVKKPAAKVEVKKPELKNKTFKPPAAKRDPDLRGYDGVGVEPPAPVVKVAPVPVPAPSPVSAPAPVAEVPQRSGWFSRLKQGLSKSSSSIGGSITSIFTKKKLDKATLQELEDTLIQADLGLAVAERIIAQVSHGRYDKEINPDEVKQILAAEVAKVLKPVEVPFNFGSEKPFVIA